MDDLATLAHMLGYGWSFGCRAQYVGEDFKRNRHSWEANKRGKCREPKPDQRLKIHYSDFSLAMKRGGITWGEPVTDELVPQVFYEGDIKNNGSGMLKKAFEYSETTTRKVTHTVTSNWQKSHEAGFEISYSPAGDVGGVSASMNYKFQYENGEKNSNSNGNQDTKAFKITTTKEIEPHKSIGYKVMISKTRTTQTYTAKIIARFSAELDGWLRYGGGYHGDANGDPNFHNE